MNIDCDGPPGRACIDFVGKRVAGFGALDAFPDRFHVDIDFPTRGALDESKAPRVMPVHEYASFARHVLSDSAIY